MSRLNHHAVRMTLICVLLVAGDALPGIAGDEEIFSAQVPPNVMLMIDNFGSMNAVMEHPSFDSETFVYSCDFMAQTGNFSATLADDNGDPTWCYSEYAEWLYSIDDSDNTTLIGAAGEARTAPTILTEIDDAANGQNYITGDFFAKYQVTRITAARDIARDVIYQTNSDCPADLGDCGDCGVYDDRVRFGVAQFHSSSHGGFVRAENDAYSANQMLISSAITSLDSQTGTPLDETLFKIYTYFMSRDASDRPVGQDGITPFPEYEYRMSNGNFTSDASLRPGDPMTEACQKNFVIMITDGEPTSDNFASSGSNTQGFAAATVPAARTSAGGDLVEYALVGRGDSRTGSALRSIESLRVLGGDYE